MDALATQNWGNITSTLNNKGYAILPNVLDSSECETSINTVHLICTAASSICSATDLEKGNTNILITRCQLL